MKIKVFKQTNDMYHAVLFISDIHGHCHAYAASRSEAMKKIFNAVFDAYMLGSPASGHFCGLENVYLK